MHFLSSFRSFCTRKYNNVSCRSSLKFRSFCPFPLAKVLKVLNVACGMWQKWQNDARLLKHAYEEAWTRVRLHSCPRLTSIHLLDEQYLDDDVDGQ